MRFLLPLVLVFSTPVFAQAVIERASKDELIFMQDEEPAMRRAYAVARDTLDALLDVARRGEPYPT